MLLESGRYCLNQQFLNLNMHQNLSEGYAGCWATPLRVSHSVGGDGGTGKDAVNVHSHKFPDEAAVAGWGTPFENHWCGYQVSLFLLILVMS